MFLRTAVAVLVGVIACAGVAQADIITYGSPVSVQSVMDNGPLNVGGWMFSDFMVSSVGIDPPSAGDIFLQPASVNGQFGLLIQGFWMVDQLERVDTLLGFKVTPPAPHMVHQVGLQMAALGVSDGAVVSITEMVYDVPPEQATSALASLSVFYSSTGTQRLSDTATIEPQSEIWVLKDIGLSGRQGDAHLSMFFQTYDVPEPATMVLLTLGGLGALLRRRSQTA